MASKKNKNKKSVEDTADLEEVLSEETEEVEELAPRLTQEEGKKLFLKYRDLQTEIEAAQASIAALIAERSAAVQAIYEGLGKGPFKFDGATFTVMSRTAKEEGSGTSYFFKRLGAAVQDYDF
jgi:hypothetical protein